MFQVIINGLSSYIPVIRFTLTLERKPIYYLLNIIIPTIVLAVLSALTFAVPVESGEKMSLGISILLAFSVFMLILQENTPQAESPLLGLYQTWWRHQMETLSALLALCAGNSPVTGQWRGALMFSLICAWMNGGINNCEVGDLRRHRAHYDVFVMSIFRWRNRHLYIAYLYLISFLRWFTV